MKLLIVGAASAVGRELLRQLQEKNIAFFAPESSKIDTRDSLKAAKVITRYGPDQLINLGSFGAGSQLAIHRAEQDPAECEAVNHAQSSVLAQVCDHLNIPMLQLSSSYVFGGDKKLGYNEQDVPKPAGVYGTTEFLAEQAIAAALEKHVILRTGWMFGPSQDEVLQRWISEARASDGTVTVLRRKFSPTPVEDVARVILAIALQVDCKPDVWGIYHYSGLETKRESEFVQQVLKLAAQHDEALERVVDHLNFNLVRAELPELVNTTLATRKIFDTFGIKQRSWHGALQNTVAQLYRHAELRAS